MPAEREGGALDSTAQQSPPQVGVETPERLQVDVVVVNPNPLADRPLPEARRLRRTSGRSTRGCCPRPVGRGTTLQPAPNYEVFPPPSPSCLPGRASMPDSFRCCAVIGVGASVSGSTPPPDFGKAITSRIESAPKNCATILSQPNAMPPCGGA